MMTEPMVLSFETGTWLIICKSYPDSFLLLICRETWLKIALNGLADRGRPLNFYWFGMWLFMQGNIPDHMFFSRRAFWTGRGSRNSGIPRPAVHCL